MKIEDLEPAPTLVPIFTAVRGFAAANGTGLTRDEAILEELAKLLHAKTHDEAMADSLGRDLRFWAGNDETDTAVHARVADLHAEASAGLSNGSSELRLDAATCAFAVRQLQNLRLSRIGRDVLGEAYETLIFPALRGGQGQFFTPKNVARCMFDLSQIQAKDRVLDPACGTGGFLHEAADALKVAGGSAQQLVGVDKDSLLARMTDDSLKIRHGGGTVVCANSLLSSEELSGPAAAVLVDGSYDVIITNPPFGAKIPVTGEQLLRRYELAHVWKRERESESWVKTDRLRESAPPQILFIERCLQLLREGGRLVIVLPEGIGGNQSLGYLRQWILGRADLLAVVDCPLETFMPSTSTKTIIMVLEKRARPVRPEVFMAIAERCGHDRRGRPTVAPDGTLLDDFPEVASAWASHSL